MTETTTQPDPQLGTASWRITEWFRDYRRTRPGGGTYGDAVTKLCQATTPIYGDDVLSACWTLSADVEPARRPLTVADIPAGIWVAFNSDWRDPPGDVVATFATEAEALDFVRGPGNGYGWTVLHVPAPGWRLPTIDTTEEGS